MSYSYAFDFRVTANGQNCVRDRDSGQGDKTQSRIFVQASDFNSVAPLEN